MEMWTIIHFILKYLPFALAINIPYNNLMTLNHNSMDQISVFIIFPFFQFLWSKASRYTVIINYLRLSNLNAIQNFTFDSACCFRLDTQTLGGYLPENGIRVRAALKTPFSHPPDHFLRPPFQNFSVRDPTFTWNHKFFWKICISEPQNWGKIQILCLEFGQISVPRASNWTKISSLRPQIWWQSVF